jgi:hypothetical protein
MSARVYRARRIVSTLPGSGVGPRDWAILQAALIVNKLDRFLTDTV